MTGYRRSLPALVLACCLAASAFAVVYPVYVIRPFRAQGARELAAALLVLQVRPWFTILLALAATGAAAWYWRLRGRVWVRAVAAGAAALTVILVFLARVNIYELMFHPAGRPSFGSAAESKLDAREKVIAVRIGPQARAYPVRIVSYHHIINDVVAGSAIVATY